MTMTLKDGTKINVALNGNNYITTDDVSNIDFSDSNFACIVVDGTELHDQKCTNVFAQADGTHIIFRQMTASEVEMRDVQEALIELAGLVGGA